MEAKPKVSRGIQSVVIGMRVLSAVASNRGPATLSAIAGSASLSASQAHRYLSSLIQSDMIRQDNGTGLYDLGAGAINLGLAALSGINVFQLAGDVFREVAIETGHTCLVAVWGDAGPTVIRWYSGSPAVLTSIAIGSVLPLLSSATGMVFSAFANEALVSGKITKERRGRGVSKSDYNQLRNGVRSNMHAEVSGDLIPGLHAISAPVFDLQGRLVFAATLISSGNAPKSSCLVAKGHLLTACQKVTEAIGGEWISHDGVK